MIRMHWELEALAVLSQTESADKSDALQTLRAVRRRPAVAKRLECVRLQRRLPKPSYDSMTGLVHGEAFQYDWARSKSCCVSISIYSPGVSA